MSVFSLSKGDIHCCPSFSTRLFVFHRIFGRVSLCSCNCFCFLDSFELPVLLVQGAAANLDCAFLQSLLQLCPLIYSRPLPLRAKFFHSEPLIHSDGRNLPFSPCPSPNLSAAIFFLLELLCRQPCNLSRFAGQLLHCLVKLALRHVNGLGRFHQKLPVVPESSFSEWWWLPLLSISFIGDPSILTGPCRYRHALPISSVFCTPPQVQVLICGFPAMCVCVLCLWAVA